MHGPLLQAYDTLGSSGGGTLELTSGVFQVDETINFGAYGNVSIQGAGIAKTILALPPSPIGTFAASNGSLVGLYNTSVGGPVGGVTANFIQLSGTAPVDNFEMCDLTVDAEANKAGEDWSGSLIFDESGGTNHVYSNIAEVGFFGPSTTPNGLHLESSPQDQYPGLDYVVDNLWADNNTLPFENYSGYKGGPNFLNVGTVVNCTLDRVTGIGQVAFEVAPPRGCLVENWNISGHITIDPATGGSWGGSLFQNVTVSANGTAATTVLSSTVPDGTGRDHSNFTALRWNDDRFYGTVVGGANLVDAENSTFDGELNATPAVFEGNTVTWAFVSSQRIPLPIEADGSPVGGSTSVLSGDSFTFLPAVRNNELFQLNVPTAVWTDDSFGVGVGNVTSLLCAPDIVLTTSSVMSGLAYRPLSGEAPRNLSLLNASDSPGFRDLGATVSNLTLINDNFEIVPAPSPNGFPAWLTLAVGAAIGIVLGLVAASAFVYAWRQRRSDSRSHRRKRQRRSRSE